MAKCDQTQPNSHALAASKPLKLVIAAFFAPSEHGEKEFNVSSVNKILQKELSISGNNREDFGDLINGNIMISFRGWI